MEILQDSALTSDDTLIPSAQCRKPSAASSSPAPALSSMTTSTTTFESRSLQLVSDLDMRAPLSISKLEQGANPPRELEFLISAITVRESYFSGTSIKLILSGIPGSPVLCRKNYREKKGCVFGAPDAPAGEEVYTIAILLMEALQDVHTWDANLLGTDINSVVLSDAASGMYKDWAFRTTPKHIQDKYFVKRMQRSFSIRMSVKWRNSNISI